MRRSLASLVGADFRERVRRPSFPLTLAPAVYLGYTVHAGFWTLRHGGFQAQPNAAYIGVMTALLSSTVLSLFGFYLVKNTVGRDRSTGVGQILATTPMRRATYTLAKALSNFTVLALMVAVLAAAASLVAVAGTDQPIDWMRQVIAPFGFLTLPMMAVCASAAVLFETIRLLRAGFGNVVWFLVWALLPAAAIQTQLGWLDLSGLEAVRSSLVEAQHLTYPKEPVEGISLNAGPGRDGLRTFPWLGVRWTAALVSERLAWFAFGLALALLAAIPFDRFDSTGDGGRRRWLSWLRWPRIPRWFRRRQLAPSPRDPQDSTSDLLIENSLRDNSATSTRAVSSPFAKTTKAGRELPSTLARSVSRLPLPRLLVAELKLLLGDQPILWYLGALGLLIAESTAPLAALQRHILPIAWIWPLLVWSRMGTLSRLHGTEALLGAAPRPVLRQLPATWTAGFLLALLVGLPAILRLLLSGTPGSLASLGAVLFVPSLALALGAWSGTPRLFEIVYLMIWYIGPLSGLAMFDFLGSTQESVAMAASWYFALLSAPLVTGAAVARILRLRR